MVEEKLYRQFCRAGIEVFKHFALYRAGINCRMIRFFTPNEVVAVAMVVAVL